MEPVIPIYLADWLSHHVTNARASIVKRLTWFTSICHESECMTRGPVRPSRDGAIAAALSQGWKCENAAQRNPRMTCPECLVRIREEQAAAGPRPVGFKIGARVRFKNDPKNDSSRLTVTAVPYLWQVRERGNWAWCVSISGDRSSGVAGDRWVGAHVEVVHLTEIGAQ